MVSRNAHIAIKTRNPAPPRRPATASPRRPATAPGRNLALEDKLSRDWPRTPGEGGAESAVRTRQPLDHLGSDLLRVGVEGEENASGDALVLARQCEQYVLGPDVAVVERTRLVLAKDDDLAGPLRESLKHAAADASAPAPTGQLDYPLSAPSRNRSSTGRTL